MRFDANVGAGLPWRFTPERTSIEVRLGEVVTVDYFVVNEAARETAGVAAYNVAPLNFGGYFQKINCFCFSEQRMKPGEKRDMTVVFYVDPAIADDVDARDAYDDHAFLYLLSAARRRSLRSPIARRQASAGQPEMGPENGHRAVPWGM